VGTATIYRIERSDETITGYASTLVRIQAAFERAEIEFIENDDIGGYGLRPTRPIWLSMRHILFIEDDAGEIGVRLKMRTR
jgi:hypothetical protein